MIIIAPKFTQAVSFIVDVHAIALWPFVVAAAPLSPQGENHERIHLAQQLELGIVGFYLLYVFDYFLARLSGHTPESAYMEIRFEKEAYAQHANLGYLETRPFCAWLAY